MMMRRWVVPVVVSLVSYNPFLKCGNKRRKKKKKKGEKQLYKGNYCLGFLMLGSEVIRSFNGIILLTKLKIKTK